MHAELDHEVNLKAALEISELHKKLDQLRVAYSVPSAGEYDSQDSNHRPTISRTGLLARRRFCGQRPRCVRSDVGVSRRETVFLQAVSRNLPQLIGWNGSGISGRHILVLIVIEIT